MADPVVDGGVISIPEFVPEDGSARRANRRRRMLVFVHPASQSETSDNAAIRLKVNFGLPALIYPQEYVNCQYLAYRTTPGQDTKMCPPYA
jgi:hypothetical protein